MKVAVIGSRGLTIDNLEKYLPRETTEIISGGAKGIDACAREYAVSHGIKLTEFLPEYEKYGIKIACFRQVAIQKYCYPWKHFTLVSAVRLKG